MPRWGRLLHELGQAFNVRLDELVEGQVGHPSQLDWKPCQNMRQDLPNLLKQLKTFLARDTVVEKHDQRLCYGQKHL